MASIAYARASSSGEGVTGILQEVGLARRVQIERTVVRTEATIRIITDLTPTYVEYGIIR